MSGVTRAGVALVGRDLGPCGPVDHSLGGAAVPLAADRPEAVRAVAVIGAPSESAERILAAARGNASSAPIGADHLLTAPGAADRAVAPGAAFVDGS